jgi:hypothetical protein
MMASVAHDLRTPLTALHGHLEALAGTPDAGAQRSAGAAGGAGAKPQGQPPVAQLFELAALQSTDRCCSASVSAWTTWSPMRCRSSSSRRAPARGHLHGRATGPPRLDGDLHLIERALTNLIDNAVRHAPGDQPVRVSLRRVDQQARSWSKTGVRACRKSCTSGWASACRCATRPSARSGGRRPGPGHRAARRRAARRQPAAAAGAGWRHAAVPGAATGGLG